MSARLESFYRETVVPNLIKKFEYANPMQVPRLVKITLNMGVGEAVGNKKILENAVDDMTKIAGQKPITTLAKKSIATFNIRDGWPIGCKVTLRRAHMLEFLGEDTAAAAVRAACVEPVQGTTSEIGDQLAARVASA